MKYSDLVTPSVMNKLMAYAFCREGVDLSIYRFSRSLDVVFGFVDAQRDKIVKSHCKQTESGEMEYNSATDIEKCSSEIRELLSGEIQFDLPTLGLNEKDFEPDDHKRPQSKDYWLTAMEMGAVLRMSDLLEQNGHTPTPSPNS